MSDQSAPLANSPEARTETGELKDTQGTQQTQQTQETTKPESGSGKDQTQGKTETKPEGDKKDDKSGVPEKYEFKAPEGYELNEEVVTQASEMFKEMGLSQEQAQKLVDFYADQMIKTGEAPINAYEELRADWRKTAIADKEIGDGREGLKPAVKEAVSKAIDSLGPDLAKEFRSMVDITGVGDNPSFLKAVYKWAEAVTEGKPVPGTSPTKQSQAAPGQVRSAASTLFPNLPSSNA